MNFDWTESEQAFRADLTSAVRQNIRPGWTHHNRDMAEPGDREAALEFCGKMGQLGYLTPHWPAEYGGREASFWEQAIISEEMWAAGEPRGPQYMNTNWIGPAIMRVGTDEQRQKYLPMIARGEAMWCQGFSEPDSGSDLASLRTTAVRDGDSYLINGQKIWTSYAHAADFCFLLARTDPNGVRGEGISIFIVPMNAPGVEVRDIPNPWVEHLVHEMYFDDVVVPSDALLGEEHHGWAIVRGALANERIGIARHECAMRTLDGAIDAAAASGRDVDDPELLQAAGRGYAWAEAARSMNYAAVDERVHDEHGRRPLASVSRAVTGPMETAVGEACTEVLGEFALALGSVAERQLASGTLTPIAAGSLEIQYNLIARTCLNLPKG